MKKWSMSCDPGTRIWRRNSGSNALAVFGSYAKGRAHARSDVDLVVEFDRPIGFRFMELGDYLEGLLGKKVDLMTRSGIESIRVRWIAEDIERSIVYV